MTELMETGAGRAARSWGLRACKSLRLVCFYPSRAVALGCVWCALGERGLGVGVEGEWEGKGGEEWVRVVGGGKMEVEEWREVVAVLRGLK